MKDILTEWDITNENDYQAVMRYFDTVLRNPKVMKDPWGYGEHRKAEQDAITAAWEARKAAKAAR